MSETVDTAGAPKAPKPERKRMLRRAGMWVGGLIGLIAIADEARVGTERFDLRATYEETLERARQEFEQNPNRCENEAGDAAACATFDAYLSAMNIPGPEAIEGLVRLMEEFRHPVHFYSGTTLTQKFLDWAGGMMSDFSAAGRYAAPFPVEIRGHDIFLPNMTRDGEGELRLTTRDVQIILSELAHAYHVEDEGAFQAFLHHLNDLPHLLTPRGFGGAYVTQGAGEYEVHRKLEPLVRERFNFLVDGMREYFGQYLADYTAGVEPLETERPLDPEAFTYEAYAAMLARVEEAINQEQPDFEAEEMLRILEQLEGFSARLEQLPDKTVRIRFIPTRAHYEAGLALLRPYQPDGRTITEIMPRITPDSARAMLASFEQYGEERGQYESRCESFRFFVAVVIGSVTEDTEFTPEVYQRVMERLAEAYPRISTLPELRLEFEDQMMLGLLGVVNGVSRFDPSVQGRYGVYQAPGVGAQLVPPQVLTGDEHYQALKRIFDRTR